MASNKVIAFLRDHGGKIVKAVVYVAAAVVAPNDAVVSAIRTAILGLSDAVIEGNTLSRKSAMDAGQPNAANDGPTSDCDDRLLLDFADDDGQIHTYHVVAPIKELWVDDGSAGLDLDPEHNKLDPAHDNASQLVLLVELILAEGVTTEGVGFASYLGARYGRIGTDLNA